MCLIIANPNAENIPFDIVLNAYSNNSDGFGIMWSKNGFLRARKGMMNVSQIVDVFNTFHENKQPYVAHFRYSTHGTTNAQNCHPFPISTRKGGIAMMHNGTLTGKEWIRASKSDTAVLAERISNHIEDGIYDSSALFEENIPELATRFGESIGADKLVFMNGSGKVNIFNENNGFWINGIWFSNLYSMYQAKTNILSWCRGSTKRDRVANEDLVKIVAE